MSPKKSKAKNEIAHRVSPDRLRWRCDPAVFQFTTTEELEACPINIIGQDRALEAIQFGARIERSGYNLFVLGPPGTGKSTAVRQVIDAKAADQTPPDDWVYVNDFETAYKPKALSLPPGRGKHCRLGHTVGRGYGWPVPVDQSRQACAAVAE